MPTVALLHACPSLLAHTVAPDRVGEHAIERLSQTLSKLRGIAWLVGRFRRQVRINEIAGLAIHDHFRDPSHSTGHDWRGTGHSLQVDQAKRFIDRGTTEH